MTNQPEYRQCPLCSGKGIIYHRVAPNPVWGTVNCRQCKGTGKVLMFTTELYQPKKENDK